MNHKGKPVATEGVVYFVNSFTGGIAFYFSYGLEPGHEFEVQVTSDAVNYVPLHRISTVGNTEEVYFTYNVSTSAGPWPRVVLIS